MNNKKYDASFPLNDNISISIVERFKNFRREFEIREKKLNEYKSLIDQHTDDTKISREVEKYLREQVISSQNRSIQLQTTLNKLTAISEQQKRNQTISENIEKKIEELNTEVTKAQENIKNLKTQAMMEIDLQKQNDELKSVLKVKESELNLIKINHQLLLKEKSDSTLKLERKQMELEEELKKFKEKYDEMKIQCDKTILIYKKEIEERDEIIKEYERERKGLLEEFDTTKIPDKIFTKADSTVSLNMEERENMELNNTFLEVESQNEPKHLFYCTTNSPIQSNKSTKKKNEINQKLFKKGGKQRPQIFSPESKQQDSSQPKIKRRLFSTNCNHYFN